MATSLVKMLRLSKSVACVRTNPVSIVPVRTSVYSTSGGVLQEPKRTRLGVLKVLVAVIPFLYIGATAAKEGAEFLEENDIFVPSDDDDD